MSKDFRPWKIDEAQLLPPRVQDYVPKDHVSRLIVSLVRESLDLCEISGSYRSGLGQPPFDPRMMTALLLHGYASGLYSSRRIAKAAVERADFMMIVAGDPPDFRTISEFRKRHLKALAGLFVQVLKLAEKAGLVKLGHVALEEERRRAEAEEKRIAEGRKKNGKTPAPPKSEPDGKSQRNFTDADSRILKTKDGYIQASVTGLELSIPFASSTRRGLASVRGRRVAAA
jgi:transposase